ncbi:diadenylate cyclase CdaA [Qiania dongpingensis]|uniref:Diadenylate cyclase n=1 Tax=Qiania dongpingensis TaxID=2763669 RepID=A0A7G9G7V4_9FIRM|nr:diadenylate cyclase CdaA [Qiania dongpingensis]QNM06886.1 TIGR00159 family protein [Qiania dongpingensis]
MTKLFDGMKTYLMQSIPDIRVTDVVEMIIIAVLLYNVMLWIKNTRAWVLLKGILVLLGFILVAYLFHMNTILWLADKTINVGIIAVVIIFQPELRRALEQLGRNKVLGFLVSDNGKMVDDKFSDKTMNEIVKATFEMSKVKTGALIVIERKTPLAEYERTGILVDGVVTSQLLLNIFEHNTPLHDGAVVVRGNRIVAATCYLPLSDNMAISKDLGTRHRAGVGVSEVSDSVTIIVSEETGTVSVAFDGGLRRGMDPDTLREELKRIIEENEAPKGRRLKILKGWQKHEKKADK